MIGLNTQKLSTNDIKEFKAIQNCNLRFNKLAANCYCMSWRSSLACLGRSGKSRYKSGTTPASAPRTQDQHAETVKPSNNTGQLLLKVRSHYTRLPLGFKWQRRLCYLHDKYIGSREPEHDNDTLYEAPRGALTNDINAIGEGHVSIHQWVSQMITKWWNTG